MTTETAFPSKTFNLSFSEALALAKQGRLVGRRGWNGKGMFVFIIDRLPSPPGTEADSINPTLTVMLDAFHHNDFKEWWTTDALQKSGLTRDSLAGFNRLSELTVPILSALCLKTATGEVLVGWLASQTDILAMDWGMVNPYNK